MRARIDKLEAEVATLRGAAPSRPAAPPSPSKKRRRKAAPAGDQRDPTGGIAPGYADGFHFGSYGRVVAGADHRGHPGRDGDIVARGSRLDESTYAELELRREDYWEQTGAYTRVVATVAFRHPIFHYDGRFGSELGVRNLYIEESGLGLRHLKVWAGSRMYRGDDIYLLDFWPLDNLNTIGGGASYEFVRNLVLKLHAGINQPDHPFFLQTVERPRPLDQPGATTVRITDRQRFIGSAKLSHIFAVGKSGGIKPVVYGEVHYTGAAQREVESRQFETLPDDVGFLVGTQLGLFTGVRSTHLNLVFRYAGGLAAYGELNAPFSLSPERTSKGAREILVALSGNYEVGPFGLLAGAYWRQFRDASGALDFGDLGEGIVVLRPTLWFGKVAGLSLEGSYQAQRRGVLVERDDGTTTPVFGHMGRVGLVPFLTPAGRGSYARPHLRFIYLLTARSDDVRLLYAQHDPFSLRTVDHFFGIGAEWWFGSTSYFRE
jgi:maltoporin